MAEPAPLVLLHPFPLDPRFFDPLREHLSSAGAGGRWLAVPRFPGFGGAPLEERPSIDAFADRVAELAAGAPGGRAVLLGVSMGGYVALSAAARHPDRVLGLVLAATRSEADAPEALRARAEGAARVRAEGADGFLDDLLPRLVAPGSAGAAALERARELAAGQPAEAVARALEALGARADRTHDLPRIAVPALVLSGLDDRLTPPEVMRPLAEGLPRARLVTVPGAGHLSALERPGEVAGAVLAFLTERCDGTAGG